jgi:hypothetical protein
MDYLFGSQGAGCTGLADLRWLNFVPDNYVLVLRSADVELQRLLSAAIAAIKHTPEYMQLEVRWLHISSGCAAGDVDDTDPIGIEALSGVFLIAGCLVALATLIAIVQRLLARADHRIATPTNDATATDSELIRAVLATVTRLEARVEKADEAERHGTLPSSPTSVDLSRSQSRGKVKVRCRKRKEDNKEVPVITALSSCSLPVSAMAPLGWPAMGGAGGAAAIAAAGEWA